MSLYRILSKFSTTRSQRKKREGKEECGGMDTPNVSQASPFLAPVEAGVPAGHSKRGTSF